MKKEYFTDNLSIETLAKFTDTMLKYEKTKKSRNIKINLLKIVPAVAVIALVIGVINILPIFISSDNGINAGSEGVGQPDATIYIHNNDYLKIDDNGLVAVENSNDEEMMLFVPPIVEKNFFEEKILANITNQRDHDKMLAYYVLLDIENPEFLDFPPPTAGHPTIEEMIVLYPICETVPIYVLDPYASDRELFAILGFLKTYTSLVGEDLIQMYEDYGIPYENYDLFMGESYTEEIYTDVEIGVPAVPNYGLNIADDGTEYLEFKNESLYAALIEYFGLDRWYGNYITLDMLNQINSISVKVRPEYNYFYDNVGLREEFGLDCKYIEYTINGKTLDILPEKFMEGGVLEGHMEQESLDINQYFDYESGYYITKTDLSLEDKLLIFKIIAWGGAIRMPVERNDDGSYYTTLYNASPSIYLLGFPARYYDQTEYDSTDIAYMPYLQEFNVGGMLVK